MRNPLILLAAPLFLLVAAPQDKPAEPSCRVLIAYFSADGHTEAMARAVAEGARSVEGAVVDLVSVKDAGHEALLAADAVILGSPVYNANVAPAVQEFINGWPFRGAPLADKLAAAFVTAGGISAGEELVQVNLLHSMMVFGMIAVGGPTWRSAFGASGVVAEDPFRAAPGEPLVAEAFLAKGRDLGKRVASLAARWRRSR